MKKNKYYKKACLALFLLLPFFASAQNVSVVGKTNKTNALVRLLTYNEMLTWEQTVAAETHSDANGMFTLNADIQEITPSQIAVNLDRVDMVLSPGGKYNVEIFVPERNDNVSFFEQEKPSLNITSAQDDGLSEQLLVSEELINNFVYENLDAIYRGRKMYLIDTLENRIDKTLTGKKHDYVNAFVRYKLAAVKMAVVAGGAKKIITQYFDNQPVMYMQTAYTDLFNEAFEGYLSSRDFNQQELENALYSGYDKFTGYLKKNDFLSRNPQLAELVSMKYLYRIYYENHDMRTISKNYLNKIKSSSKYLKNRVVAADIITRTTRLSYDSEAPSFSLKDKKGNVVQLSDYQDNIVVLQFVDRVSDMTAHQFETLNELQRQWGSSIVVVTIATEESFDDYVQLFENQKYNWQLLNLGDDILLLEKYNIKTCPDYVILKTKGRIGMAPAPSPEQSLDYHVRRILNIH